MAATSATCPACGVAVVPGYVRCPKCHRALPSRRATTVAGGTSVSSGGSPIVPIIGVAIVALGIILYFTIGDSDAKQPVAPADTETEPITLETPEAATPIPPPDEPTERRAADPNRVDPNATARDLERALKNQRLWSRVEVVGAAVEVRSGSCSDAAMIPTVDAARAALRNAGLTRLRCLENSGAVVFEREL